MKTLSVHSRFLELSPKFIHFGDWEVPAYFSSIIDEHICVREKVGIFDISHMGLFEVTGVDTLIYLDHMTTNAVSTMAINKAQYSVLCNEQGGIIDDIFLYKVSDEHFMIIVNASNKEKDFAWFDAHTAGYDIDLHDMSSEYGIFALQGPRSGAVLQKAFDFDLLSLPFHAFTSCHAAGTTLTIATTGYTGEWGCEIIFPRAQAEQLWDRLFKAGEDDGLQPIGFGARDTLRLEAGCLLYGNDMDEMSTPYEAGLGWIVKMEAGNFIGKDALLQQKQSGIQRKLIGFELCDKGIARHGYAILKDGKTIGEVTSGSVCPTVKKTVGFGLVQTEYAVMDEDITIQVRNRDVRAKIVPRPFYKRKKNEKKMQKQL